MRAILPVALASFLFVGTVLANNVVNLTGSDEKTSDALSKSDAVFVGELTYPGNLDTKPGGAGYEHYSGLKIAVSQVFKGSVDPQAQVNLVTLGTLLGVMESPPKKGSSYVFFVQRFIIEGRTLIQVRKLLPGTAKNIAAIKKLISN